MNENTNRLSHSSVSRWQRCPTDWYYHYKHHYRPITQSAALLFGSAIDYAITSMLNKDKEKDPKQIFEYFWRFQEVNSTQTYLPTSPNIVYANSDYDKDLVNKEDWNKIENKLNVQNASERVRNIIKKKEFVGWDKLDEFEKILLNYCNWFCLYHKGLLMLQAVKTKILPRIKKILGTQVHVKLDNGAGDTVIGFADLVCEWEDGRVVIFDFKTSTREYDKDSVLTSPQLTLYVHSLSSQFSNTRTAGYIVLRKTLIKNKKKVCSKCSFDGSGTRFKTCNSEVADDSYSLNQLGNLTTKRCDGEWIETIDPQVILDILIDNIPERTEEIVIENIDQINKAIHNNIITRNLNSCVSGYGKCVFFNKCYHDTDQGLIKMKT